MDLREKVISQKDMILVMSKTEDIIKKWIEVFFIGEEINTI